MMARVAQSPVLSEPSGAVRLLCHAVTTRGTPCTRAQDGVGTRYCQVHHRLHFGRGKRTDAHGNMATWQDGPATADTMAISIREDAGC